MRRLLPLAFVASIAVLSTACGGTLPDAGRSVEEASGSVLPSGAFALSNARFDENGCTMDSWYGKFAELGVDAGLDAIELAFESETVPYQTIPYRVDGLSLRSPWSGVLPMDFSDPQVAAENGLSRPFDCRILFGADLTGEITGASTFSLADHWTFDAEGPECDEMAADADQPSIASFLGVDALPCSTIERVDASL